MSDIKISWQPCIHFEYSRKGKTVEDTWHPNHQTIEGKDFVEIKKWDSAFVKFVRGKPKCTDSKVGPKIDCNTDFLENLRRKRNAASNQTFHETVQLDDNDDSDSPDTARKKQRRAKKSDQDLVAQCVDVEAEPFRHNSIHYSVTDNTMKLKWDVGNQSGIWVELKNCNMKYIKAREHFFHPYSPPQAILNSI